MERWQSGGQAVEMNTRRRRSSKRRLIRTVSPIRGRKDVQAGLEQEKKTVKKKDLERGYQQKHCEHCQQRYPACNITSRKPTSKKTSQLLAEIVYTVLLGCLAFASLGQQLILVVTSAVQILGIALDRHLAGTMSQKLKAPAHYEALEEMSDAPGVPTPTHSPSPNAPPLPPTYVIAEPAGRRYLSPMPYPGAPGAPWFSGHNVTEFLQRFQNMCNEYEVKNEDIFQKLPWYCEKTIGDYVKSIPEYVSRDGDGLFKVMRKDYRKHDLDQQINSRNFLESLKTKTRTEKDDLKQYCRQFHTISHALVERGQLEKYTRAMWFIQGLPPKIREKVVRKVGCDTEDADTMDYTRIYGVASAIADTAYVLEGFNVTDKEQDDLTSLVETYQSKVTPNPAERHVPPVSKAIPAVGDDRMDSVTRALESLSLSTRALVNNASVVRGPVDGPSTAAANVSSALQGAWNAGVARSNNCYYCSNVGHRRFECPYLNASITKGEIHLNDQGRVFMGRSGDGGESLLWPRGQTQKEAVENTLRRLQGKADIAPVHASSVRLGADYGSDADTDEEADPVSVEVLAARSDRQLGKNGSVQWKGQVEKEGRLPTVKTARPGDYANASLFGQVANRPEDTEMADAGALHAKQDQKVSGAKDKRRKLAEALKEEDDPVSLLSKILDAPVSNLKVRELLACSPSVHKLFFRSLDDADPLLEKKAGSTQPLEALLGGKVGGVQPGIALRANNIAANMSEEEVRRQGSALPLVAAGCPMVRATIFDTRVKALIDSGAEICLMARRTAEAIGLPIRIGQNLSMVAATGQKSKFVGVCTDVPVEIGDIVTTVHVLVVDHSDYDLILGRPFERRSRMRTVNNDDGSLTTQIFSTDGSMASTIQSAVAVHPQNRTIAEIFPLKD